MPEISAERIQIRDLEVMWQKAEARVQVLEKALGKYGAHSGECASMDGWKKDDWPDGPPCTCGLAAVLASEGIPEEAS